MRAFIIFALVTVAVYIGIYTENIALNPARLMGPAIIGQAHAASGTGIEGNFGYSVIFLLGELLAVLVFTLIANKHKEKHGLTPDSFKKEVRLLGSEVLVTKARYEWVLVGNKALEKMNKEELMYAAEFCEVDFAKEESEKDLEYDIIEWIIFGLESDKKPPLITKKKVKTLTKEVVVEKTTESSNKKNEKEIKEEAKREADREKLKAKFAKQTSGKKVSQADLKKMKLTDLYGIGVKREAYFHENGITDMVKLSNRNIDNLTKKLIDGLPSLKSWTYEDKRKAIESNIEEAKFMVNELLNN